MEKKLPHLASAKRWSDLEPLKQKKLLQGLVAAVFVRGDALEAIRLTEQFYPIIQISGGKICFYSGSDGSRYRTDTEPFNLYLPDADMPSGGYSPSRLALELNLCAAGN